VRGNLGPATPEQVEQTTGLLYDLCHTLATNRTVESMLETLAYDPPTCEFLRGMVEPMQPNGEMLGAILQRLIMDRVEAGMPLEQALESVAERMDSDDFSWAVMAIRIQREVGGNLAELLMTVSETMVQRDRLRRDVNALTAEGRMSAIILALLPIGLGLFMWASNPVYMSPLGNTGIGQAMLGIATVAAIIGFIWMKKTITIEI